MTGPAKTGWRLWRQGEVLRQVRGFRPLLASWDAKSHPSQVRLHGYLDELETKLGPLDVLPSPLALELIVDVEEPGRLLRHYDLENYLTPVVHRLGASRFVLVEAEKRVGGGSTLTLSRVAPGGLDANEGWSGFCTDAGSGATKREWKERIWDGLRHSGARPLPEGPVEVQLAWRCHPGRNWSTLWKPTGDAMGPILGEPHPKQPFNPRDDRVVRLGLHLNPDASRGHEVTVGMWWRPSSPGGHITAARRRPGLLARLFGSPG